MYKHTGSLSFLLSLQKILFPYFPFQGQQLFLLSQLHPGVLSLLALSVGVKGNVHVQLCIFVCENECHMQMRIN